MGIKCCFPLVVALAVVVFAALGVAVLLPTETTSRVDPGLAQKRLRSDLSVSNQVEFLSGKFQRESVVVFRLLSESFLVDKFTRISAGQQRRDCVESVSELMESCGLDFLSRVLRHFGFATYAMALVLVVEYCNKITCDGHLSVRYNMGSSEDHFVQKAQVRECSDALVHGGRNEYQGIAKDSNGDGRK